MSGGKTIRSFPCVGAATRSRKFKREVLVATQRSIGRNRLGKCGVAQEQAKSNVVDFFHFVLWEIGWKSKGKYALINCFGASPAHRESHLDC